jgi:hypothetical protein
MKNSNASLPVVATSNGWTPIAFFDFESDYAQRHPVLVWMAEPGGHEWFEVGLAENGSIISGWQDLRARSRSTIKQRSGVPVAFKLIEGPDIRELKRLHQRCARHFSCRPCSVWNE